MSDDIPMPSLAWFKKVRDAVRKHDQSLTRDFAILANLPYSRDRMLEFLDAHFPLPGGQLWSSVAIEDVPSRLAAWEPQGAR